MPREANTPGTMANKLGQAMIEERDPCSDTLATALASYFEGHCNRPAHDPEDDETGYGRWVMAKTLSALEHIAEQAQR